MTGALNYYDGRSEVPVGSDFPLPVTDFWIEQAIREIYSTYGDVVSVTKKKKSLVKFGRTLNADANVKTTVAIFQDAIVNETFATTNSVDKVVSTSGSDTGAVTIEGHTIDGSGNLTFVVQDATLTGQTAVTLGTPLARANRLYVKPGTFASPASDLQGDVTVFDSTLSGGGVTSGKPDQDAAVKLLCRGSAGKNQTEKAATSISSTDYWIVSKLHAGVTRTTGANAKVDVDLEFKKIGGVWRSMGVEAVLNQANESSLVEIFQPFLIVPKNSDVRMVATSDTNDTTLTGRFSGILAQVVS